MKNIVFILIVLIAFASIPLYASIPSYKVSNPYVQVGTASWYGEFFRGKKTANGERFDPAGLTAAHRTLPLGTVVEVTNLENGKKITVRINDRGPYVGERIIDLSRAAAREIGMIRKGIVKVKIEEKG